MSQKNIIILFLLAFQLINAQDEQPIALYTQFAGRYDFTFFGNTLNQTENGLNSPCSINTSSSAGLTLGPDDEILAAYLYWAGSGTGVFDIKLNNQTITAERDFSVFYSDRDFFSAFADVTAQVQAQGNGTYTVSDFDLTDIIGGPVASNLYCVNGTNFGGWAIVVVYKNENLPLNQLNVYDGLEHVPDEINVTLPSLNVIDNDGAKIGFLAWEGDRFISVNETLRINGNILSNPPLNPSDNAFNGTNSFTGADTLYNMDLDVYNIQNYIQPGDTSAEIQLTSGQDFVMINAIVTKLNSQLPNATISADNFTIICDQNTVEANYTVYNTNSTDVLPAGTPISVYVNGNLFTTIATQAAIPIAGSESGSVTLIIPEDVTGPAEIEFVADDTGNGTGIVLETDETDNNDIQTINLLFTQEQPQPQDVVSCLTEANTVFFDFSAYEQSLIANANQSVSFYTSQQNADAGTNPISNTGQYLAFNNPERIYVRVDNGTCFATTSFLLIAEKCPPVVYNYVTPNGDGYNDTFFIEGLRNIFLDFKLSIYNRWGNLLWTGNNNTDDWNCVASVQKVGDEGTTVPTGTYYYVLELNDPDYPEPMVGWVYVTK